MEGCPWHPSNVKDFKYGRVLMAPSQQKISNVEGSPGMCLDMEIAHGAFPVQGKVPLAHNQVKDFKYGRVPLAPFQVGISNTQGGPWHPSV